MRRVLNYREFPVRRFGVEMEVSNDFTKPSLAKFLAEYEEISLWRKAVKATPGSEGWAQSKNNDYWHVKFDRTCGPKGKGYDSGWEIASFVGSGAEDVRHIGAAAKHLASCGVKTNINCGLHVHVEVKDCSPSQMGILLARWLRVESYIFEICQLQRKYNPHCMPLETRYYDCDEDYDPSDPRRLWIALAPTSLSVHDNHDKRFSINTVGYATSLAHGDSGRNTVELRAPEGILDENHVKNWTRLFVNFVDAAIAAPQGPECVEPCENISELLSLLGLYHDNEFTVFDCSLIDLKMWFLQKLALVKNLPKISAQASKHLEFISQI